MRSSEPAITKSSGLASVTLDLDLQIRALTGNSFNGVPIISNRQYTGSVRLNEGEPAIVVRVGHQIDSVYVCSIADGAIVAIRAVRNPEKLEYLKAQLAE